MPAPQIISFSDLGLVEKKANIICYFQYTRETLQTQTDMSLQLCWCGFVCLEKPSLVTLAVFFRKENIIIQAIISVGTFLSSEMVCCTEAVGVLPSHFNNIQLLAAFTIL